MTQIARSSHSRTVPIAGYAVRRVGLGAMQFTGPSGMGEPVDPSAIVALIRAAVDSGINLIDTSGYYGPEVANRLIAQALHPYPADVLIATKVGARRTPDGGFAADDSPAALRAAVHDNLRQLRMGTLPLVHLRHMPGTTVSLEDRLAALIGMREEGLIQHIGISNVSAAQLTAALALTDITSVQNEFSLGHATDGEVLAETTRLGIAYLAFRPLGNGELLRTSSSLASAAQQAGVSPAAWALAWVLDRADNVVVIPGTASEQHMRENLAAERVGIRPAAQD